MAGIFVSYRREDAKHAAGRLVDRLVDAIGSDHLFMDIDNIEPGLDFVKVINDQVSRCDVLLALIGPQWLDARDRTGARRLDNPNDFVRIEIESALARDVRVVPILLDGAVMPSEEELPASLQPLLRRQAVRISHERFAVEADDLALKLQRAYAPKPVKQPSMFASMMSRGQTTATEPGTSRAKTKQSSAASAQQDADLGIWNRLRRNTITMGFLAGIIATAVIEQISGSLLTATVFSGVLYYRIIYDDPLVWVCLSLLWSGLAGAVYAKFFGQSRTLGNTAAVGAFYGIVANGLIGRMIVTPLLRGYVLFAGFVPSTMLFSIIQGAVFGAAMALIYRWLAGASVDHTVPVSPKATAASQGQSQSANDGRGARIVTRLGAILAPAAALSLAAFFNNSNIPSGMNVEARVMLGWLIVALPALVVGFWLSRRYRANLRGIDAALLWLSGSILVGVPIGLLVLGLGLYWAADNRPISVFAPGIILAVLTGWRTLHRWRRAHA